MNIEIQRTGQRLGVFSAEEAQRLLADGTLSPNDLAWYDGASSWGPLSSVPGIGQGQRLPRSASLAEMRKCPYCAEEIRAEAIKCKHCGSMVPAAISRTARVEVSDSPPAKGGESIFFGFVVVLLLAIVSGGLWLGFGGDSQPPGKVEAPSKSARAGESVVNQTITPVNNSKDSFSPSTEDHVYDPKSIRSIEDAKRFLIGTWTTVTAGRDMTWCEKCVIRADGTLTEYSAPITNDNWGEPSKGTYKIVTGKYSDTGERYYGILDTTRSKLDGQPTEGFLKTISNDGSLLETVPPLPGLAGRTIPGFTKQWARGDKNPFSK